MAEETKNLHTEFKVAKIADQIDTNILRIRQIIDVAPSGPVSAQWFSFERDEKRRYVMCSENYETCIKNTWWKMEEHKYSEPFGCKTTPNVKLYWLRFVDARRHYEFVSYGKDEQDALKCTIANADAKYGLGYFGIGSVTITLWNQSGYPNVDLRENSVKLFTLQGKFNECIGKINEYGANVRNLINKIDQIKTELSSYRDLAMCVVKDLQSVNDQLVNLI